MNMIKPGSILNDIELKNLCRQLIQNAVFFSGLIFAGKVGEPRSVLLSIVGFMLLSALTVVVVVGSSSMLARKRSVSHPFNSFTRHPLLLLMISLILILACCFFIRIEFGILCLLYVLVSFCHDVFLTPVVLIDVMVLGVEFSIKASGGAAILDVSVSPWLLICTFLAALIVSLGKRRNELVTGSTEFGIKRPVLGHYSRKLLDQMIAIVGSAVLIAYTLYTVSDHVRYDLGAENLLYTLPFVVYGVLRYLYLIHRRDLKTGSELVIIRDAPMMINTTVWLTTVFLALYI